MSKFLITPRALPAALLLAGAFALPIAAHADDASKRALAVQLVKLQQKNSAGLVGQITDSAMQQEFAHWGPQLQSRVPPSSQKDVSDRLQAELKKLQDNITKVVQAQADKTAEDALVPIFMSNLSEDDLKTIVTALQTPAWSKFAALSNPAIQAWGDKTTEGAKPAVLDYMKNFDATAEKIISSAANGNGTGATSGTSSKSRKK